MAGNALTAAQLNILSGDLNETAPAKFTAANQYFVATGANAGVARTVGSGAAGAESSTASTSYVDIGGVIGTTVTTGTAALILIYGRLSNNTVNWGTFMGYAISGATTRAADNAHAVSMVAATTSQWIQAGIVFWETGLTPGNNQFVLRQRVDGGTGFYSGRSITVMPF